MERDLVSLFKNIPAGFKNIIRSYESCLKKIKNNFWSIEFNSVCFKKSFIKSVDFREVNIFLI